ncbi:hypothetical protein Patl1_26764 [Pistacia atlantica]|uniref:Uncharacterized protein n=1 Tax=Pistacia atlantica TaxID=434234 RepID=A0ACC1B094_9ROSI|nr:hypothetical protein Patl1_26764 [Pistacia atlantica]
MATTLGFSKFSMASTVYPGSKEVKEVKKLSYANSMAPEKVEIFKSMEGWARDSILPLLKPVEKSWQPTDMLPDSESDGFIEQIIELRERTKEIPDDCLVSLVGNMITEEALPTYQSRINGTEIYHDESGIDDTPWAIWTRAWSSEENRHGDLLNKTLALAKTLTTCQFIHHFKREQHSYLMATQLDLPCNMETQPLLKSVARSQPMKSAMKPLIAGLSGSCLRLILMGTMVAFADMLKYRIAMPGQLMFDGQDMNLFDHYSNVATRLGVYTATDYINILEHLVSFWNVEKLVGLTSEAQMAQQFVCALPNRLRKMEERARARAVQAAAVPFSWLSNREV